MKLSEKDITPEVKNLVRAYLPAQLAAQTARSTVDRIGSDLLQHFPLFDDTRAYPSERITGADRLYLCHDKEGIERFWTALHLVETDAGVKPKDMARDFCPALVLESVLIDIKNELIDETFKMIGSPDLTSNDVWDMKKQQQFVDLAVGLVVSLPDFKPFTRA